MSPDRSLGSMAEPFLAISTADLLVVTESSPSCRIDT